MARDLPDVWRDEDGPSRAELERWTSGEIRTITIEGDRRRLMRSALKSLWWSSSSTDRLLIDALLAELKG